MSLTQEDYQNESQLTIEENWEKLLVSLKSSLNSKPDVKVVLFLIGVQELGKGAKVFSKEEKQDLIHIAVCKILSLSGYFELEGTDTEGWPKWKEALPMPFLSAIDQELFLKYHILEYFSEQNIYQ